MTRIDLREGLERIAAGAPVAHVPGDTFARGRRARRRDRGLAAALAVVVVALVAGTALWLPTRDQLPVADDGASLAVPDRLYPVPPQGRQHPETDLRVGVAAAAWIDEEGGRAVVVDAAFGGYHVLALPDGPDPGSLTWPSLLSESVPFALSPDGTRLVYGTQSGITGDLAAAAVAVVDLTTGEVVMTPVEGGAGVELLAMSWSPDSRWVVWRGWAWQTSDAEGGRTGGEEVAGRIRLGVLGTSPIPAPKDTNHTMAITNDGTVVVLTSSAVLTYPTTTDDVTRSPLPLGPLSDTARVDPSGQLLLVGIGADGAPDRVPEDTAAMVVRLDDPRVEPRGVLRFDPDSQAPRTTEALGWVADSAVFSRYPDDGSGTDVLLAAPDGTTTRVTGSTEYGVPPSLTLATDLMTLDRPSVTRPQPEWPWSVQRRATTYGLAGLGLAVVLVGLALYRRKVRRTRPTGQEDSAR